jgi:hypothetical protein
MRRKTILVGFLLLVLVIIGLTRWRENRGPMFEGRHVADWVDEALQHDGRTPAFETVLKIGEPAVPFIARQGLYGRAHTFHFLSTDRLWIFANYHPRLHRLLKMDKWDFCISRHLQASWLLYLLGTNAQAAIPDVIACLDHCPELHYMHTMSLLDTLGEISGTNPAAIPFLTSCTNGDASSNLHVAYLVYGIDGRTNFFIEICRRMARTDPKDFVEARELDWLCDDHQLNQHLVPLLEGLYASPMLDDRARESVMFALESRSNDATAAIARILLARTNASPPAK